MLIATRRKTWNILAKWSGKRSVRKTSWLEGRLCSGTLQVYYVDLPFYGTPMSLAWEKHRMRCIDPACAKKSWVLEDHRIAAKNCLLTTRTAKWATVQFGGGRTIRTSRVRSSRALSGISSV